MIQFFSSIADRLLALFDPETLGVRAADFVANLAIGLVTFLAYYLLWRIVDGAARVITRRASVDKTNATSHLRP